MVTDEVGPDGITTTINHVETIDYTEAGPIAGTDVIRGPMYRDEVFIDGEPVTFGSVESVEYNYTADELKAEADALRRG